MTTFAKPAVAAPSLVERRAPAWLREIETALALNPQVLLYGNVRDRYLLPDEGAAEVDRLADEDGWAVRGLHDGIWSVLRRADYPFLLVVDVVDGLRVVPEEPAAVAAATTLLGRSPAEIRIDSLDDLRTVLLRVATSPQPAALVVDYASRIVLDPTRLSPDEHRFFAACEKLSHTARQVARAGGAARYNPILWVANNERDLPLWLTASNEAIRKIALPVPDFGDRLVASGLLMRRPAGTPDDKDHRDAVNRFSEQTQGLSLRGMIEIVRLARGLGGGQDALEDATRCYRVGVLDNPWRKHYLRNRLATATEQIEGRVRGQGEAVQRSADILIRSVMGLSGAHASAQASRPRGILFFAGPTGVGKTELAKALSELVFGDERAYIRFDMSEFSAEHASERLIGAPPGYVGHDAGGELTNAVRERPFSLLLFDEIEKAHPRILDKFLQILDDGRLTDGSGSTVYFSEAVLVFTSNLGVTVVDENQVRVPNATPDLDRADLEARVSAAIKQHFTEALNRPELLNRLGDNIVVFNFIDRRAAGEIFEQLLGRVAGRVLREQGVRLDIAPGPRERLLELTTADLSLGGRGIGSALETTFVNPLARALFLRGATSGEQLTVTDIARDIGGVWTVTLT